MNRPWSYSRLHIDGRARDFSKSQSLFGGKGESLGPSYTSPYFLHTSSYFLRISLYFPQSYFSISPANFSIFSTYLRTMTEIWRNAPLYMGRKTWKNYGHWPWNLEKFQAFQRGWGVANSGLFLQSHTYFFIFPIYLFIFYSQWLIGRFEGVRYFECVRFFFKIRVVKRHTSGVKWHMPYVVKWPFSRLGFFFFPFVFILQNSHGSVATVSHGCLLVLRLVEGVLLDNGVRTGSFSVDFVVDPYTTHC